jgi:hypothetical protein
VNHQGTSAPGRPRARRRAQFVGALAVVLVAASALAAVLLAPEPGGPLTAHPTAPVPPPLTVEGVDLCTLLTDDEAAALLGPAPTRAPLDGDRCTFTGVLAGRVLDVIAPRNTGDLATPGYAPNTTVAGYPARIGVPDGYRSCTATVVVEPGPDRPTLTLQWLDNPDCESLRTAAELIVPRLPPAPH